MTAPTGLPAAECDERDAIAARQGRRLDALLAANHGRNAFYTRKLDDARVPVSGLTYPDDLARLPVTTKTELAADQEASPPWGSALSEPLDSRPDRQPRHPVPHRRRRRPADGALRLRPNVRAARGRDHCALGSLATAGS